jgi:hypothetical protein
MVAGGFNLGGNVSKVGKGFLRRSAEKKGTYPAERRIVAVGSAPALRCSGFGVAIHKLAEFIVEGSAERTRIKFKWRETS